MANKSKTLFFAICLFSYFSCSGTENLPEIRNEIINGTRNVFNSFKPLKGQIVLELEKTLEIDSHQTESSVSIFFDQVDHDDEGNIYFADSRSLKIHKFRPDGAWVSSFSVQEEWSGEFSVAVNLQIVQGRIWIAGNWPLQLTRYGLDGSLEFDWKSDRYYNFYLQPVIIDENRFLAVGFQQQAMAGSPERKRFSALMDFGGNILQNYFTRLNTGPMILTVGSDPPLQASFTSPFIIPRILHAFDRQSGIVYVLLNQEYRIEVRNFAGEILRVVHKEHENRRFTERDKEELVRTLASGMTTEAQEEVKRRLPDIFCAVADVVPLGNGYFALHRVTGINSIEIDVFDREGRFVYTVLPSEDAPGLSSLRFFADRVGWIEHLDNGDIYREYQIKNLPEVFRKESVK